MPTAKETAHTETEPSAPAKKRSAPIANEGVGREHRTVQTDIADADKVARTGSKDEPVRNTPPAGKWNDVA